MIRLKNVSKYYYSKGVIATGFSKVNLTFDIGEFVAITGESGSGKSTLLNVISGLDTYEEGEVYVEGKETSHFLEKDWENYRRKYIGNIYQNFNLINSYTVYQNIDLIMSLNGTKKKDRKRKILELLKRVDMLAYKNTKVSKLSGGQKQRVAIARALAKEVPVIIADEPTGNLDKKSAESIIELLKEISKEKLIIIVTHNYEQVEKYVTRKITMHDGRVLEDKRLKETISNESTLKNYHFKNMNILEKLRIGTRNTFNIFPKFILLLIVYSFVVTSIMGEYSFFKKAEYEESKYGYNYVFSDLDDHRVIIKKKDKTAFTKEEITAIKEMKNVKTVIENDLTTDIMYTFVTEDESHWIGTLVQPKDLMPTKDIIGRLPTAENEILVECEEDSYLFRKPEEILEKNLYLFDDSTGNLDKTKEYKIVGLKYRDAKEYTPYTKSYVSDSLLEDIQIGIHERYSNVVLNFINDTIYTNAYSNYMAIKTNNWVPSGYVFISEDENFRCPNFNCVGQTITITNNNLYYTETKNYQVQKTYNRDNFAWIMNFPNYNKEEYDYEYNGPLYMNPGDYKSLFNKGTYQMSIYVDNINEIESTVSALEEKGYETLMVKDTLVKDPIGKIIRVIKIVITAIFVIVLFFISYFIIKIILKSRNIYFSILRMLGSSKKVCLDLLITELMVVSNLSYFIFILLSECNRRGLFHVGFIDTINDYFNFSDYIVLYFVIVGMSLLISLRYSRKLFKNSVMSTYREEV